MSGFGVDVAALTSVSTILASASAAVEGVPGAPPPPRAGVSTAVVNAGLAVLCLNAATVVTGFQGAVAATDATARDYQAADRAETFQGRS